MPLIVINALKVYCFLQLSIGPNDNKGVFSYLVKTGFNWFGSKKEEMGSACALGLKLLVTHNLTF